MFHDALAAAGLVLAAVLVQAAAQEQPSPAVPAGPRNPLPALQLGGAVSTGAAPQDRQPAVTRRIFAVSQGAMFNADKDLLLLKHLITLTGKKAPRICFLPTAKGDNADRIVLWYETMHKLPCQPRHQRAFISSATTKDFESELLSADAIFVAGGNTLNMLAIWKAQGIDKILRQAYDRGVVLAGESAGGLCWFENGSTDSRPGKVTPLQGLGFLKGSFCPHYDGEKERRPTYHQMILAGELDEGIAADERVALLYENETLVRIVTAKPNTHAYRVRIVGNKIVEERLPAEVLTRQVRAGAGASWWER